MGKGPSRPVPSVAQTIAQAKKNLAKTGPESQAHPAIVASRPKPKEHNDTGGLVAKYKKMSGSAMW